MAAPDNTADSITGLGETIKNLALVNATGFNGIQSSLRKEFSSQNKLLGGYLGKNLQRIADAITDQNVLKVEAVKQTDILAKSFGLDEDEIRRQKEQDKKDARGSDDKGGSLGSSGGGKGKGIFGLLGSMFKVLGGGFLKILGPIWSVLKILFKGLGFIAVGAGLLMALTFFKKDAKGQEDMINDVINFFKGIGEALQKFGNIFTGSFMEGMDDVVDASGKVEKEGLGTKFKKFGAAWDKVTKSIGEISIGEYKGLDGVARFMGDMLNKVAGWLVDVGTGIAELITNPTETLAKLQVKIESFFMGIADMLGRVFDKFFNMEFILSMLPQELVPDSLQESVSRSRLKEKQKRIKQLDQNDKNTQNRLDSAEKQLADEQSLGKKANATTLRNLTLSVERAKMDLEANKEQKDYLKEQMLASRKNIIQERLNQRIKQITGIDNQDVLEDIQEQEEKANKNREKMVEGRRSGDFNEMSLTQFKELQKKLEAATGISVGEGTIDTANMRTADSGITKEFIKSEVGQKLLNEFKVLGLVDKDFGEAGKEGRAIKQFENLLGQGIQNQKVATAASLKATELQTKLDKDKANKLAAVGGEAALLAKITKDELDKISAPPLHEGGLISKGGLANVAAGEMMMDNQAVHILESAVHQSGILLQNLQRQKLTSGGSQSPIIITNAPTTQVNQNSAMVLPPSPIQPGNSDSPRLLN